MEISFSTPSGIPDTSPLHTAHLQAAPETADAYLGGCLGAGDRFTLSRRRRTGEVDRAYVGVVTTTRPMEEALSGSQASGLADALQAKHVRSSLKPRLHWVRPSETLLGGAEPTDGGNMDVWFQLRAPLSGPADAAFRLRVGESATVSLWSALGAVGRDLRVYSHPEAHDVPDDAFFDFRADTFPMLE